MPNVARAACGTRLALFAAAWVAVACSTNPRPHELRLYTDDLAIRVSMEPTPPRAIEDVRFRVVVRDRETGQPIEKGQGRIFATNEDRHNIDNGLTAGAEVGTYYTTLRFVNSGPWAMGIQFRRDSTARLQRTNDWMQDVLPDSGPP
jgi:hypothetical protein